MNEEGRERTDEQEAEEIMNASDESISDLTEGTEIDLGEDEGDMDLEAMEEEAADDDRMEEYDSNG